MIKNLIVISPSASALGVPNASQCVQDLLSAHEISRFPEARYGGPGPVEACERSLVASPPFPPALSVSPTSFLRFQPELDAGPRKETIKFRLDGFAAHPFSDAVAPGARARLAPILVKEDFLHRHQLRAVLAKARFHFFTFSPRSTSLRMSRDPNIAGFHLAVASTGSVESQSIANFDFVRIYSRRLQIVDVQKHIVCDKSEATGGIPHFQFSG